MTYSDKFGTFFGRLDDEGYVMVFHVEDGAVATRLDANVYPLGSSVGENHFSARHEHPEGIVLLREDAERLGIELEA